MLDLLRLYIVNILKPVLEEQESAEHRICLRQQVSESSDDWWATDEWEKSGVWKGRAQSQARRSVGSNTRHSVGSRWSYAREKDSISLKTTGLLDASGPKLIHGERAWLLMYQLTGQINWLDRPLYQSLIYKAFIWSISGYIFWVDFFKPIIKTEIIDSNYKNPIFLFIGFLSMIATTIQALLTLHSNLFNLSPFFKVLTTPRLCFIKTQVQHIVGTRTLASMTIFYIYQGILFKLISLHSFHEFFVNFSLGRFLLDSFVSMCLGFFLVGIYQLDFYIRVCFGFWLIAMKTNLEYKFACLQKRCSSLEPTLADDRRRELTRNGLHPAQSVSIADSNEDESGPSETASKISRARAVSAGSRLNDGTARQRNQSDPGPDASGDHQWQRNDTGSSDKFKSDTLDEIQKNLNTMDDHLEVCRGIQNTSLTLITLNTFLSNGAMMLLAYNLLANRGNYYHGTIVILLSINNTFIVFLCYIGDSWISYALSSFVQTVEDEYFLQGGGGGGNTEHDQTNAGDPLQTSSVGNSKWVSRETLGAETVSLRSWLIAQKDSNSRECSLAGGSSPQPAHSSTPYLIRKKDVIFCHEFLHQFENHLATPWSKLNVKIHINMLRTFVTLIAAQIIFDHEH